MTMACSSSTSSAALVLPDGRTMPMDRPRIMGILNITSDSFSDGGLFLEPTAALVRAQLMIQQGADLIDVGAQSTRPGSHPVPESLQIERTVPIIKTLVSQRPDLVISIDTPSPLVAQAALDAGASIINDVQAGQQHGMLELAAQRKAPIILMHMQGTPATMQLNPTYGNVVTEVVDFLKQRAQAALDAGVASNRIVLDPGIGFGKTKDHNLALLAHLDQLVALGYAVLLGASRKRFMSLIAQHPDGSTPPPHELVGSTCATTTWGVQAGVRLFRVHDVQANRQAADLAWAVMKASPTLSGGTANGSST